MALLLAACAETPQDVVDRETRSYANLLASAEMTAGEWLSGSLPDQFAERALDNSAEALSTSLGKIAAAALDSGAPPQSVLGSPEQALLDFAQMRQAVAGGDRSSTADRIAAVDTIRRQIKGEGG